MTFEGKLERYDGRAAWLYVEVPELIGAPGPFGMRSVTVTIAGETFTTKLWPMKDPAGRGFLPISRALCERLGWEVGKTRTIQLSA